MRMIVEIISDEKNCNIFAIFMVIHLFYIQWMCPSLLWKKNLFCMPNEIPVYSLIPLIMDHYALKMIRKFPRLNILACNPALFGEGDDVAISFVSSRHNF